MTGRIALILITVLIYSCKDAPRKQEAAQPAPPSLKQAVDSIIQQRQADIGVAVIGLEDEDTLFINGDKAYTMMSVVKFPQALAILHQVDAGTLSLDQPSHFTRADLNSGYSPIKDSLPQGNFNMPLKSVLQYAVSRSDNAACDKLYSLLGGPKGLETYLHQLGIDQIGVGTTYARMKDDSLFVNYSTPKAMAQLLREFYLGNVLAPPQRKTLLDMMIASANDPRRIKGMLPGGTVVAHKTGTSATDKQQRTAAFNDAGIVTLPNGRHFAIAVFINDSKEPNDTNAATIATITRTVWDHFTAKQPAPVQSAIQALINADTTEPFNGVLLVDERGSTKALACQGLSDRANKVPLACNDQFAIGSVSKQITAVLVLRAYEKGLLQLHVPIDRYLPDFKQEWARTVTIHHLLSHTHGVPEDLGPFALFPPGTQFQYSQSGYGLLAMILEKISDRSLAALSEELFHHCGMRRTFHPAIKRYHNLVDGYTETADGQFNLVATADLLRKLPVAAGGFISTVTDMAIWNDQLHQGKLLSDSTYRLLISPQPNALRQHLIFGPTRYGYGITVDTKDSLLQLGQTGYIPGFASMNFYFPATQTTVIMLSNVVYDAADLPKAFRYHTGVLGIVRDALRRN